MDDHDWLAERFEAHRTHLRAVASRLLGSLSEADDAVQESWLRLSRADTSGVENLGGWLTTVIARVCLDMLRARRARRDGAIGAQVPEPTVRRADETDPEHEALLADAVGLALLVVLDTLAPAERLAFVLHDLFPVPFDEIAAIVGRSPAASSPAAPAAAATCTRIGQLVSCRFRPGSFDVSREPVGAGFDGRRQGSVAHNAHLWRQAMGNVVVSQFVTLDGVFQDPGGSGEFDRGGWAFQFDRGPAGDRFKLDEVLAAGALLLGRVTYQGFAKAWPSRTDDVGFADKMNRMPKYVVSATLDRAEWNNSTVLRGDVPDAVGRLKRQVDGDILINGSGQLVRTLMAHDLVDEYRLMVFPIVLGSGKRLFADASKANALRLVDVSKAGDCLILIYRPAGTDATGASGDHRPEG